MKLWFNIVSMDRESPVFFFVRMESTLFFPYNGDTIVLEGSIEIVEYRRISKTYSTS